MSLPLFVNPLKIRMTQKPPAAREPGFLPRPTLRLVLGSESAHGDSVLKNVCSRLPIEISIKKNRVPHVSPLLRDVGIYPRSPIAPSCRRALCRVRAHPEPTEGAEILSSATISLLSLACMTAELGCVRLVVIDSERGINWWPGANGKRNSTPHPSTRGNLVSPRPACAPWRGGATAPSCRPGSSCACEIHVSSIACAGWVGMYA